MRINTNVSSLNAQESSVATSKSLASSLEKLSSGLRINKASDDASGLAIADKLRTQATSIKQAIDNGNSAITLLQIADKSMAEQSNILDTVKAKLIQANTATTSSAGREAIRKDINKLLNQFDNIAKQTNYNGSQLISSADGLGATSAMSFQVGENDLTGKITLSSIQSNTTGYSTTNTTSINSDVTSSGTYNANVNANISASLAIADMINITGNVTGNIAGSLNDAANITINGDVTGDIISSLSGNASSIRINGNVIGNITASLGGNASSIRINGNVTGNITSSLGGNASSIRIYGNVTGNITSSLGGDASSIMIDGTLTGSNSATTSGAASSVFINNQNYPAVVSTTLLGLKNLSNDGLTASLTGTYQDTIDNAITKLNTYRSTIGSTQSQVESAVRNLMTMQTNVKAAESIIRDVDYAQESINFNKYSIIAQAGSYAITQANNTQQNVLKLLA